MGKTYSKKLLVVIMISVFIGACLSFMSEEVQAAEKYPSRPITIIDSFGSGAGADILLREIAEIMKTELGVGIGVAIRAGAGGIIGWTEVASSKPDGYTLGYVSTSLIFQTFLEPGKIDYRNFEPIGVFNESPFSVTVHADSPWKTLKNFIDYARQHPDEIRASNGGTGAIWHVSAMAFAKETGIKIRHIPYKGGTEAKAALAGGHVEVTFVTPPEVASLVKAGKLRMLAVGSDHRDPNFPEVPTAKELGVNLSLGVWRGLCAPKNTPSDRIAVIAKSFKNAVLSEQFKDGAKKAGFEPIFWDTDAFRKRIEDDAQRFEPLMKQIKQ
jgi:tripartite-type tricarboxylate transporter receptor subunit TctC